VNDEAESSWTESIVAYFKYCLGFFLEELRKTTYIIRQDSRSPSRNFKLELCEYKAKMTAEFHRLLSVTEYDRTSHNIMT